MDVVLSVLIGLGLAAACGFRVFVPLLVLSVAQHAGAVSLDPGVAWIGSAPALIALGVATLVEIIAYWVPWLDHALDTITTPAAVIAGTIVAGSQFTYVGQQGHLLQWALALIAGGGAAATVQAATVVTRVASTATSAGIANPIFSTIESLCAVVMSVIAVVVPVLAGMILLTLLGLCAYALWRWHASRPARSIAVEA